MVKNLAVSFNINKYSINKGLINFIAIFDMVICVVTIHWFLSAFNFKLST